MLCLLPRTPVLPKSQRSATVKLWISKDFGASWNFLAHRVQQFDWLSAIPPSMRPVSWQENAMSELDNSGHEIIATVFRSHKKGHQNLDTWDTDIDFIVATNNFKNRRVLVPHGNRFLIMANRFFVARSLPSTAQKQGGVNLMVMVPCWCVQSCIDAQSRRSCSIKPFAWTLPDGQVF